MMHPLEKKWINCNHCGSQIKHVNHPHQVYLLLILVRRIYNLLHVVFVLLYLISSLVEFQHDAGEEIYVLRLF